jgi:eukaryotic-like serine/threonine-protein kinase
MCTPCGLISARSRSRKASERPRPARAALELDDGFGEAHATLGLIALHRNPGWEHADGQFRRALELNPNDATAHQWFAFYLYFADRPEEALAEIESARQLAPLSAIIVADQGHFLYAVRRFEEARARLRQAIELAPDLAQPHETLALIELESGHAADALREARAGLALDHENPRTLGEAGYVFACTGHTTEADGLLATLTDLVRRGSSLPVFAALVEMGLGQRERALDTLSEQAHTGIHGLGQWHGFDQLSADARLQKLLAVAH